MPKVLRQRWTVCVVANQDWHLRGFSLEKKRPQEGPGAACPYGWGGYQAGGARLFTAVCARKMKDGQNLKWAVQTGCKEKLSPLEDSGVEQLPRTFVQCPALEGLGLSGLSPEQPGLILRLRVLWAGERTRDLLRSLTNWITLWSY